MLLVVSRSERHHQLSETHPAMRYHPTREVTV